MDKKQIKIFGFENCLNNAYNEIQECRKAPNGLAWIKHYTIEYDKIAKAKEDIEYMATVMDNDEFMGNHYILEIGTLNEYFNLYEELNNISKDIVCKIIEPDTFYIRKRKFDFNQVD